MASIIPDSNDIIVWLLNETSGNYRNTGTFLPNNVATDLSISGTVIRTAMGPFNGTCPWFPGTDGYPVGASGTRNYLFGAKFVEPQPPMSISCWVNLRNYNSSNTTHIIGKTFRDHTITSSWASPFFAIEMTILSSNGGGDTYQGIASGQTTQVSRTIIDFPIPLQQWCHIGMTHDGTAIRSYLNGCPLMTYSGSVQSLSTAAGQIAYKDINYAIAQTTGTYIPGVDDIGNHGDEVMTSVALPFPVNIYGTPFNSCFASSNGFVEFGQNTNGFNFSLPNGALGAAVTVFERDTTSSGAGLGIFTTTVGTAPNRTFIIEWRIQSLAGGTINCEIKFFEGNDVFETVYTTSTTANTGSIGIQSAAGGKSTVFSNSASFPAANTKFTFTPSTAAASDGYWSIGAVPATGSATKEEANYSIKDVRIANIVRPLSYFQSIYKSGVLPIALTQGTKYYKLRVYDLSCPTPTAVTWVDTQVSLTNVPSFPCGGPYSAIEVIESWFQ